MRRGTIWSALALLLLLPACPSVDGTSPNHEQDNLAIVNGQIESGWAGVGALTATMPGYGYTGSFCTATLVDPEWVLTAAHCLSPSENFTPTPYTTEFYLGPDANPEWWGKPSNGTFYSIDAFYVHPGYAPLLVLNDVALAHLSHPINGVPTYPLSSTPFDGSFIGDNVVYVGYGATNGTYSTGSGVKRSTAVPIDSYSEAAFTSPAGNTGTCFGDSGGPGFLQINGNWQVVGTVSTGWSGSGDPCLGPSSQMRVDYYYDWFMDLIDPPPTDCNEDPLICTCPEACFADGVCHDGVCRKADCFSTFECLQACGLSDTECATHCFALATPEGNDQASALVACINSSCGDIRDPAALDCGEGVCKDQWFICSPLEPGTDDCATVVDCSSGCASDQACLGDCYGAGTAEARSSFVTLQSCFEDHCAGTLGLYGDSAACSWEFCASEMESCAPPTDCTPGDGTCLEGFACGPSFLNRFDCLATKGIPLEGACTRDGAPATQCTDGLECGKHMGSWACLPICMQDSDCDLFGSYGACLIPVWEGVDGFGTCIYGDADGDGLNGLHDCDDLDKSVGAKSAEICDGKDNDCNGEVDDNCVEPETPDNPGDDVNPPSTEPAGDSSGCQVTSLPRGDFAFSWIFLVLAFLGTVAGVRRRQGSPGH